jgi:hypothetical protein
VFARGAGPAGTGPCRPTRSRRGCTHVSFLPLGTSGTSIAFVVLAGPCPEGAFRFSPPLLGGGGSGLASLFVVWAFRPGFGGRTDFGAVGCDTMWKSLHFSGPMLMREAVSMPARGPVTIAAQFRPGPGEVSSASSGPRFSPPGRSGAVSPAGTARGAVDRPRHGLGPACARPLFARSGIGFIQDGATAGPRRRVAMGRSARSGLRAGQRRRDHRETYVFGLGVIGGCPACTYCSHPHPLGQSAQGE